MGRLDFKTVIVVFGLLVSAFAQAAPGASEVPCNCREVPGLTPVGSFASFNVELNDRFSTLDGHAFYRSPEQIDAYKLKLDADKLRLSNCPGLKTYEPKWKVILRATTANVKVQGGNQIDYDPVMANYLLPYLGVNATTSSASDISKAFTDAGFVGDTLPLASLFKVLNHPPDMTYDQALVSYGKGLSTQQKIALVQYIGYLAHDRFDLSKANQIKRPITSNTSVFDAVTADLQGVNPNLTAGVCADIANAQGHALEVLGLKNVYLVTWATLGGLHTTIVAQDPALKNTYYKINYSLASSDTGKEGADLLRAPGLGTNWTNTGISYYVNKVNGRTVGYVPTELGKVMSEAAGFNIHDIEPLARTTSSLVGAQLELPGNRSLQAFTGRDSSGTLYGGLSLNQAWGQGGHFPGAVGVVGGVHATADGVDLGDLYVQLQQQVRTSDIKITKDLKARIDASLIVMGSYGVGLNDPNFSSDLLGFDGGALINAGAQLAYGDATKPVSGRIRADAQVGGGLNNIAGAEPVPYLNHLMFSAEGRAKLGQTAAGRAYLVAATAVLLDYFGPRLSVRVGLETPKVGVRFEVTGRLNDDTPTFKDGSLRRASAAVGVPIGKYLRVTVAGEVPLEQSGIKPILTTALDGRF